MRDAHLGRFARFISRLPHGAHGLPSSQAIESRQEENTHLNPRNHNRPYASVRQSVGVRAAHSAARASDDLNKHAYPRRNSCHSRR